MSFDDVDLDIDIDLDFSDLVVATEGELGEEGETLDDSIDEEVLGLLLSPRVAQAEITDQQPESEVKQENVRERMDEATSTCKDEVEEGQGDRAGSTVAAQPCQSQGWPRLANVSPPATSILPRPADPLPTPPPSTTPSTPPDQALLAASALFNLPTARLLRLHAAGPTPAHLGPAVATSPPTPAGLCVTLAHALSAAQPRGDDARRLKVALEAAGKKQWAAALPELLALATRWPHPTVAYHAAVAAAKTGDTVKSLHLLDRALALNGRESVPMYRDKHLKEVRKGDGYEELRRRYVAATQAVDAGPPVSYLTFLVDASFAALIAKSRKPADAISPDYRDVVASLQQAERRAFEVGQTGDATAVLDLLAGKTEATLGLLEATLVALRATKGTPADAERRALGATCAAVDAQGSLLETVKVAVTAEVFVTAQQSTLFRGNTGRTKLLSYYTRTVGSDYLRAVLAPVVDFAASDDCPTVEVDPKYGGSPDALPALRAVASAVLTRITSSASLCPPPLRAVARHLQREASAKFPDAGTASLGGYLFLRFFCPALANPIAEGLATELSQRASRALLLISKCLQTLASDTTFRKEAHMVPLNDWLADDAVRTPLLAYFTNIVEVDEASVEVREDAAARAAIARHGGRPDALPLTEPEPAGAPQRRALWLLQEMWPRIARALVDYRGESILPQAVVALAAAGPLRDDPWGDECLLPPPPAPPSDATVDAILAAAAGTGGASLPASSGSSVRQAPGTEVPLADLRRARKAEQAALRDATAARRAEETALAAARRRRSAQEADLARLARVYLEEAKRAEAVQKRLQTAQRDLARTKGQLRDGKARSATMSERASEESMPTTDADRRRSMSLAVPALAALRPVGSGVDDRVRADVKELKIRKMALVGQLGRYKVEMAKEDDEGGAAAAMHAMLAKELASIDASITEAQQALSAHSAAATAPAPTISADFRERLEALPSGDECTLAWSELPSSWQDYLTGLSISEPSYAHSAPARRVVRALLAQRSTFDSIVAQAPLAVLSAAWNAADEEDRQHWLDEQRAHGGGSLHSSHDQASPSTEAEVAAETAAALVAAERRLAELTIELDTERREREQEKQTWKAEREQEEARRRAEVEEAKAKEREEQEAKAKEEQEAKEREAQEAKAKEEQEAEAKAQAQAEAQAEAKALAQSQAEVDAEAAQSDAALAPSTPAEGGSPVTVGTVDVAAAERVSELEREVEQLREAEQARQAEREAEAEATRAHEAAREAERAAERAAAQAAMAGRDAELTALRTRLDEVQAHREADREGARQREAAWEAERTEARRRIAELTAQLAESQAPAMLLQAVAGSGMSTSTDSPPVTQSTPTSTSTPPSVTPRVASTPPTSSREADDEPDRSATPPAAANKDPPVIPTLPLRTPRVDRDAPKTVRVPGASEAMATAAEKFRESEREAERENASSGSGGSSGGSRTSRNLTPAQMLSLSEEQVASLPGWKRRLVERERRRAEAEAEEMARREEKLKSLGLMSTRAR